MLAVHKKIPVCQLALIVLATIQGCGEGEESRKEGPGIIHAASFNLLHDWPYYMRIADRLEIAAQGFKRENIDVLGIQEASVTPGIGNSLETLTLRLGYYYVYAHLEGSFDLIKFENGNGVLSRFPIVEKEVFRFPHQVDPFENRSVIRAVIASPRGPFTIFSTHLSGGSSTVNLQQALDLAEFIASRRTAGPAFLTGDFNAQPDSPSIQALTGEYGFIDVYATVKPDDPGFTCCVCILEDYFNPFDSCPRIPLQERIDYLFLIPGLEYKGEVVSSSLLLNAPITETGGGLLWASDHVGVEGLLRLFP
jgi:endonuclease/exonuclease/phosphatase family metal-dependent hydrolase